MASAWDDLRKGWESIAASADATWKSAYAQATSAWSALIEADPEQYIDEVTGFLTNLDEWDQYLRAASTLVPQLPEAERAAQQKAFAQSREEWRYYGAGIYPYVEVESGSFKAGVGAAPVLIGAAVIVVAVAGIAWAVAYTVDAQAKRDWAFYALQELAARVESMRTGKPLPDYSGPPIEPTMQAQPPAKDDATQNVLGWGVGLGLLGLLGAGIAFGATRGR